MHHIPGATSYADLKTLPNGDTHRTFKDTAITMGLLEVDEEWHECLSEAVLSNTITLFIYHHLSLWRTSKAMCAVGKVQ